MEESRFDLQHIPFGGCQDRESSFEARIAEFQGVGEIQDRGPLREVREGQSHVGPSASTGVSGGSATMMALNIPVCS